MVIVTSLSIQIIVTFVGIQSENRQKSVMTQLKEMPKDAPLIASLCFLVGFVQEAHLLQMIFVNHVEIKSLNLEKNVTMAT